MHPVQVRRDLDRQGEAVHDHTQIDDRAVTRGNTADLPRARTADRDHDPELDHTRGVVAAVGQVTEVTTARDNFGRTIIAARTTSHASKASTIRIIAVEVTISKTGIASTTISTTIVSAIVEVVASIIVAAVVVVVIVVADSSTTNKISVISAIGGTLEIAVHRAIDTAIAATRPIQ